MSSIYGTAERMSGAPLPYGRVARGRDLPSLDLDRRSPEPTCCRSHGGVQGLRRVTQVPLSALLMSSLAPSPTGRRQPKFGSSARTASRSIRCHAPLRQAAFDHLCAIGGTWVECLDKLRARGQPCGHNLGLELQRSLVQWRRVLPYSVPHSVELGQTLSGGSRGVPGRQSKPGRYRSSSWSSVMRERAQTDSVVQCLTLYITCARRRAIAAAIGWPVASS